MENSSNIKDRVLQLPELKGISKTAFFEKIGVSYANFRGKSKDSDLGSKVIAEISSQFPDISLEWLITGQGSVVRNHAVNGHNSLSPEKTKMITTQTQLQEQPGSIAFYGDIDVTAGPDMLFTDGSTRPSDFIHVPNFEDCEVAFPMWGDSMWPVYQSGQVVLCKEFHDWRYYVPFGEVFLIITDSLRTVKYVKKASTEQNLLLVSENDRYEPFELPKDRIRRMFFVKGSVKRNMI